MLPPFVQYPMRKISFIDSKHIVFDARNLDLTEGFLHMSRPKISLIELGSLRRVNSRKLKSCLGFSVF